VIVALHLLLSVQGVLEAIRMCSAGYPTRRLFADFVDRFALLVPGLFDKP